MNKYRVTASNMGAFYQCGEFWADDEADAIRQAKSKSGCPDGLVFRAFFVC